MKFKRRKRRSLWIDVAFSSAIMAMTAFALLLIFNTSDSSTSASPNKIKEEPKPEVLINSSDSNFPGIKIVTETTNDPKQPFAIQYPQSEYEEFNSRILEYIDQWKTRYFENDENQDASAKELNISFETVQNQSGNYSFVILAAISTSETDIDSEIRTFHIQPETGKEIKMADLVGQDVEKLKRTAKVVRDHIYQNPDFKDVLLPENVWQPTEPLWRNYQNFALTDQSVLFYYGAGVFTEESEGPVTVEVPLEKLNPFLAADYQVEITEKPAGKKVALTFDDGPDPKSTVRILETLKKYDAKATFFMLGSRVEYYPEIAQQVAEAGHELGNHSWNHPSLTKLPDKKLYDEVQGTTDIIKQVTGEPATVFRPPYGAENERVRAITNLPVVLWDVDTLDWKHHDPQKLLAKVKAHTRNGSIVLMHDIHKSTADGLDSVLAYLQSQGYTFVTVSELENY
ncbi:MULTISPECIES: polysaccharide deacetylase family protein [Sporosarcina]|uniref:polysaccharide deacetylase family protein n=1 Tax=Sporosarcina TaxID=1569 RepID=UPI00129A40B9|nr:MULTISPECIES: polysaccharide deacetylase family protein [Sporosarcina]GKV66450.1 peptidoglycan-N-acetylmuramic acid deacetylase PdaC [Sporosarcina sp. NCCP-2331]GLB56686.1 peptidoglycan-N-acetylmuramic acid deacetylase PdaC [Sporosarcina sp. NCCP-2378]